MSGLKIDWRRREIVNEETGEGLSNLGRDEDWELFNHLFWLHHAEGWHIWIGEWMDPTPDMRAGSLDGRGSKEIRWSPEGHRAELFYILAAVDWYWEAMISDRDPCMRGTRRSLRRPEAGVRRPNQRSRGRGGADTQSAFRSACGGESRTIGWRGSCSCGG